MLMFTSLRDANIARQREWFGHAERSENEDMLFRAVELGGEVGEALNMVKKIVRERIGAAGSRIDVEDLADELADIVICVDLLAIAAGIDNLDQIIGPKFNATSEKYGLSTRLVTLTCQL